MGETTLNINRRGKIAVASINNPARYAPLAPVALYDKETFKISVWEATGNSSAPYFEAPDLTGYSLRMAISTTGASTAVKASETTWTWDATNKYFTGTIDLSQSDLVTALSGLASLAMKLEVKLVDPSGNRTTILHEDITVVRVADIVATPSSPHSDTFFTADEIRNLCVMKRSTGFVIEAEDGLSEVRLSCVDGKLNEQGI